MSVVKVDMTDWYVNCLSRAKAEVQAYAMILGLDGDKVRDALDNEALS